MSLEFNYYKTMVLSVKTQIVAGRRKVAKPIFFLAILKAIEKQLLLENKIRYTDELENIYKSLYMEYGEVLSPMKYPFYHLKSDGFYHLQGDFPIKSPTPKLLKEKVDFAYFDESLWKILQEKEYRQELQKAIEDYFKLKKYKQ